MSTDLPRIPKTRAECLELAREALDLVDSLNIMLDAACARCESLEAALQQQSNDVDTSGEAVAKWWTIETPGADFDVTFCATEAEAFGLLDPDDTQRPIPLFTHPPKPVAADREVEVRLWDSQWVNIVNAPEVLNAESQEEAVNLAVLLTVQAIAENVANPPSPNWKTFQGVDS